MTETEQLLRSGTTVDDLCTVLRERVISGHYLPGQRMSQAQLAAEFNVSRTPLREALQRLEADGLLVAHANRGMRVAEIVYAETEQSYAMRLLVEPATITAIIDTIGAGELAAMRSALEIMSSERGNSSVFQRAHREFHDVALGMYPASFRELIDSMHTRIHRHQSLYLTHAQAAGEFIHADHLFLDALSKRNAPLACRLLEFHLTDAAVGLVLDAEPRHRFESLIIALRGRGAHIANDAGIIDRPARIEWTAPLPDMPALVTSNLVCAPPASTIE